MNSFVLRGGQHVALLVLHTQPLLLEKSGCQITRGKHPSQPMHHGWHLENLFILFCIREGHVCGTGY